MTAIPSNSPTDDQPAITPANAPDAGSAADLIRQKLDRIYGEEPDARQELNEATARPRRSKHQQFMLELSSSGKDLATIQTEWHNYYQSLPDHEKHEVWQEFYASQALANGPVNSQALAEHKQLAASSSQAAKAKTKITPKTPQKPAKLRDVRTKTEVQAVIRDKVSAGGKLQAKHHLQSLLFGLSMGFIAVIIFLFGFFNEVIIAPFIQPSRASAATPLIISNDSIAPTATPEVIIPKINVEIPVNYTETSTDENVIENDLQDGVVHYPTTVMPGQQGNTAFFGHSSNNIFNKGKYKFAFVLLHTLVNGDTFYLTNNGKVYVYKVISRTIVDPSDVGVLGPVPGQTATATLITCDPPGTSLHRLIVVGQQISPDPASDTAGTATASNSSSGTALPGNGPTAWTSFIRSAGGKISTIAVLVIVFIFVVRWVNEPRKSLA
jgi:LPXTG-site transpeptidase (sortase) family protein